MDTVIFFNMSTMTYKHSFAGAVQKIVSSKWVLFALLSSVAYTVTVAIFFGNEYGLLPVLIKLSTLPFLFGSLSLAKCAESRL
jgi:hypothetical protein